MAKMDITFSGFSDLMYQLDKMGGDLKAAANEALEETGKIVQTNLVKAAAPYARKGGGKGYATGAMYRAIKRTYKVYWNGNVAEVGVGFDLTQKGGYHSIFIMYGTPRINKDTKVYNAIKGTKTRKSIASAQEKAMQKYLKLGG